MRCAVQCRAADAPLSRSSARRCPSPAPSSAHSPRARRPHCPGAPVARQLSELSHHACCQVFRPYHAVRILKEGRHLAGLAFRVWAVGVPAAMAVDGRGPRAVVVLLGGRSGRRWDATCILWIAGSAVDGVLGPAMLQLERVCGGR